MLTAWSLPLAAGLTAQSVPEAPIQRAILVTDPVFQNSLVAVLGSLAIGGAGWLVRQILQNRRARKALAAGAKEAGKSIFGFEEDKKSDAPPQGMSQLVQILQENLRFEREQRHAEVIERARQEDRRWERVETLTKVCDSLVHRQEETARIQKEAGEQLLAVADAIHSASRHFDEEVRKSREDHGILSENQVRLSDYVRDNLPPVVRAWSQIPPARRRPSAGNQGAPG